MRVVALEEHFAVPALVRRIDPDAIAKRGFPSGFHAQLGEKMADLGAGRLADMDAAGITMQVLSPSGPGADLLEGDDGIAFARDINDHLAEAIAAHPDRLAGFAHLPMRAPQAAADEFERAVRDLGFCGALINGMTQDRFLDDPRFDPILARAAKLDVPIYLHPNLPPQSVREAYYSHLPGLTGFRLASASWGWHSETAIHVLRLVISGAFERHRNLKLIIGHMGEGLAAMLVRADKTLADHIPHLNRSVAQTVHEHVWVTTSGLFTKPPLDVALAVFGIDRVMFSIDYPIANNQVARNFLDTLTLPAADLEKFTHGNADRLLGLQSGAGENKAQRAPEIA
jgi:predicted TIM-barrel fold metal-dependent hydrolase